MKIKVGVIFGGKSVEHEVSIISGIQAINNMDKEKYDIVPIYLTKENNMYVGELVKEVKKMGEDAKVAIRSIRRDGIDEFKAMQKNSEITEDELKNAENDIQKLTDKKIEEVDKILENKEKEIMSV